MKHSALLKQAKTTMKGENMLDFCFLQVCCKLCGSVQLASNVQRAYWQFFASLKCASRFWVWHFLLAKEEPRKGFRSFSFSPFSLFICFKCTAHTCVQLIIHFFQDFYYILFPFIVQSFACFKCAARFMVIFCLLQMCCARLCAAFLFGTKGNRWFKIPPCSWFVCSKRFYWAHLCTAFYYLFLSFVFLSLLAYISNECVWHAQTCFFCVCARVCVCVWPVCILFI